MIEKKHYSFLFLCGLNFVLGVPKENCNRLLSHVAIFVCKIFIFLEYSSIIHCVQEKDKIGEPTNPNCVFGIEFEAI